MHELDGSAGHSHQARRARDHDGHRRVGQDDTNRDVLLDFYGWKAGNPPEIVWVEAKGDVGISDLLEGFIRTEFACHQGGGHGILAVPREQAERLAKYSDFLSQAPHVKVQPFPIDDKTTP